MVDTSQRRPAGMVGFTIIWIGQIVSVLASSMSQFGLTIWMYQQTQSATALGLMQVFFITPFLIMSPIAGVMVDRYNRKLMMMISDLVAFLATAGIMILSALGRLEFWHLYVSSIFYGIGNTFQWPAYSAAISTMVPKEQLGRVNGMMSLIEAGPGVLAPLMAGMLLPIIQLTGILTIDVVTFLFAVAALLVVFVPQPLRTAEGEKAKGSFWNEVTYGFRYIFQRPSLLGLQCVFLAGNLFSGIGFTLLAPMILTKTSNNSLIFGTVQSAGAIAMVVGGVLMSAWGGFKKRVNGVMIGWMVSGLLGMTLIGLGRGLEWWIPAAIMESILVPLINGSNQAIWQAKVAPDLQGRVFSARRLIAWVTNPISPIIAGTMADYVLEPAMRTQSGLANIFGGLVGTGQGSGMGLLMVFCGLGMAMAGFSGYLIPAIRNAETLLPDHEQFKKSPAAAEGISSD